MWSFSAGTSCFLGWSFYSRHRFFSTSLCTILLFLISRTLLRSWTRSGSGSRSFSRSHFLIQNLLLWIAMHDWDRSWILLLLFLFLFLNLFLFSFPSGFFGTFGNWLFFLFEFLHIIFLHLWAQNPFKFPNPFCEPIKLLLFFSFLKFFLDNRPISS